MERLNSERYHYDCMLDLVTVQGILMGTLLSSLTLAIDNHALSKRPVLMDDNARAHRTCDRQKPQHWDRTLFF